MCLFCYINYESNILCILLIIVKLSTKELIGFEGQLLKGYKIYLTNLEKMASILHRKKGDTRVITKVSIVKCVNYN